MAKNVREIDRGWNKIEKELEKYVGGLAAAVGIQGDQAAAIDDEHGDLTNSELGAIHEFGTQDGRIPERPFLRSTAAEQESAIVQELRTIAEKLFSGRDVKGDLLLAGEAFRAKVLEKIKGGIEPALKDPDREGEVPLWRTGQLVNSISTEVVKPEEKRGA